jgi:hypothetical protein
VTGVLSLVADGCRWVRTAGLSTRVSARLERSESLLRRIRPTTTSVGTGPVTCRTRLGGVLNFYNREAA